MNLKRFSKHALSVLLVALMIVSTMVVGTITAFAFDLKGTYNFDNYTAQWDNVYLVKVGNDGVYTEYTQMTKGSNGIYSYNLGSWGGTSFYFANSNSNPTAKTQKFTAEVDSTNNCFVPSSATGDSITGTWTTTDAAIAAHPDIEPTTQAQTSATEATQPTTAPSGDVVTYCKNDAGWSKVYAYMWNSKDDENAKWPGVAMTDLGDGVWCYEVPKDYKNIIFNNGNESKTEDQTFPGTGYIWNNSAGGWEVYDTSPIRITSFTTDAASPQYTGMDITVSADAKSTDGTVSYKFSVTNTATSQTTVLSNFGSANSVVWTPTAVGSYVITLDVKDTAGNTNQRTLTYAIEDSSLLIKPVIKSVSPSNNGQIQVNTTATVNVNAGGGNTGTKLLFYKYIVTDPDGVQNTPYYSLSRTYQLKPEKLGTYTVKVFVQGSDNQTVNKTYTYESVSQISTTATPTISPTDPTATAPQYVDGDVNLNGRLDIRDATSIQAYLAKAETLTDLQLSLADYDKDGIVAIRDASAIQLTLAKL